MIVISRNGQTTIVTGWRAWLLGSAAIGLAWLVLAAIMFIWIGAAVTLAAILLLTIPAVLIAAMVQSWISQRDR